MNRLWIVLGTTAFMLGVGAAADERPEAPPAESEPVWQNLAGFGPVPECWRVAEGTPCWHVAFDSIPPVPPGCYRLPGGVMCEAPPGGDSR